MLTKKQKRSVVRTLIKAYYTYRDLPFLAVCRAENIALTINKGGSFGGQCMKLPERQETRKKYRHSIDVPGKCPSSYKEHVFWHEFCHAILDRLCLFPYLEGRSYRDYLLMHESEYWEPERFCDAFAGAMVLYRKGVKQNSFVSLEEFLFADTGSLSYSQMNQFSAYRLKEYVDKAGAERRNIDLRELNQLIHTKLQAAVRTEFQLLLPSNELYHLVYFQNQIPRNYVDEEKDEKTNIRHSGKTSWGRVFPEEERLIRWARRLTDAHAQLSLFEETARTDKEKIERSFKRFDRACKKFQRT